MFEAAKGTKKVSFSLPNPQKQGRASLNVPLMVPLTLQTIGLPRHNVGYVKSNLLKTHLLPRFWRCALFPVQLVAGSWKVRAYSKARLFNKF